MLHIFERDWNNEAAFQLEAACSDDYTINDLAYDVQTRSCSLFHVYDGRNHVASMVLRLEEHAKGRELVVVCLAGEATRGGLIQKISAFWDNLAKKNDAKTIRAHVSKKGMARLMERAGGRLAEYVYRREVV